MNRRKKFEQEINKIVKQIVRSYSPDKIILFGSLARGEENPNDADLIIIKDNVPNLGVDRIRQVSALFKHTIGVDALVYKPSEFDELSNIDPFIRQVLAEGKVLYDQN